MNKLVIPNIPDMVARNTIVSHYSGSLAYGTNLPTSDIDIRGIFVADKVFTQTPWFKVGESSIKGEDTKFYELTKFVDLLINQNPNIVESVWVDPKSIITSTPVYELLRSYREELLSSKCAFTYSGYAFAQLKRIKNHNKWINNPKSVEPPRQIDYMSLIQDFTSQKYFKFTGHDMMAHYHDHTLIPYGNNIFGLYEKVGSKLYDKRYILNVDDASNRPDGYPLRIVKFNYDVYSKENDDHKSYWDWKTNRNETRSALEEQFGYDTKHASHLVRLLRTGYEILETGKVNVLRDDAADLLDIRHGKYTYEEILEQAKDLEDRINTSYKTCTLQRSVDYKRAGAILIELQESFWNQ